MNCALTSPLHRHRREPPPPQPALKIILGFNGSEKMLAFLRPPVLKQMHSAFPVPLSSNTIRSFASEPSSVKGSNPFVVSFLIKSCGLSPQSADSASKLVEFKSLENPNLVLNLLKDHGFGRTQISKMIRIRPNLLVYDAQKTITPKLEFLRSKAISGTELTHSLSNYPDMLTLSLENTLIPFFDVLKRVVPQLTDKQIFKALTKASWVRTSEIDSHFAPNIALLSELGVPQSSICYLVSFSPGVLFVSHARFVKTVEKVKDLGLDPSKMVFVLAISVVHTMPESKWASKFEVFGSYGWSKEDVYEAFKYQPMCVSLSDKNISRTMDFLVSEMGWPSKDILKNPEFLFFSLRKRIKPRCLVVQALMSKGLVGKHLSLASVLNPTEEQFVKKFVTKFQETVPELLNVYKL